MVPPDSFSTAAPQSSSDFWSGCEAGTQCEIFRSKVFSWASAGVTPAASSSAKNVFLIGIISLLAVCLAVRRLPVSIDQTLGHIPGLSLVRTGFRRSLQILLYDIIIIASLLQNAGPPGVRAYNIAGSKYCGRK